MHTKSHRSSHTTKADDEARAKKRERKEIEWDIRASLVVNKLHQRRELEMDVGESGSLLLINEMSITDGAEVDVVTTESSLVDDPVGSVKPNPPTH